LLVAGALLGIAGNDSAGSASTAQSCHYRSPAGGSAAARAGAAWKKAKLERITLHNARYSFRSYLDYVGISEARCDRYLGHANHSIGRRYTHAFQSQLASDAALLDAYLGGATTGKVVPLAATG
jgi:integrase